MAVKKMGGKTVTSRSTPDQPLQRILQDPTTYRLAFYRGSRADQHQAVEELREGLEQAGSKVLTFNCQRYTRQERVWPLLVQSLLLRVQELADHRLDIEPQIESLLNTLDEFLDGQLSQSRRVRFLETLDKELERLVGEVVTQPPLVMVVKGLGTLEPRTMVELVEFISGSLEIRNLVFILTLREGTIAAGLEALYHGESPLTPQEFLEESFPVLYPLGPPEPKAQTKTQPEAPSKTQPGELPELPPSESAATPTPPAGPASQLLSLYLDPLLQEKLLSLQLVNPPSYQTLDQDPSLLLKLERLARGDASPALRRELAANDQLQALFAEAPLRAILAKPPYFDPTPVDLDRQGYGAGGVRMVSEGPSFTLPEVGGLESENGTAIQARISQTHAPPEPEAAPPLPPLPPRPKVAKKRTAAKKVKAKPKAGTRKPSGRKVKEVRRPAKPPGHRLKPATSTPPPAAPQDFLEAVEPESPSPLAPYLEAVQAGDSKALQSLLHGLVGLDPSQLIELAQKALKLTFDDSNRIKVVAVMLLAQLGGRLPHQLAQQVKDRLLTMTGHPHQEVRDEAAKALTRYRSRPASAQPPAPPAFTPVGRPRPAAPPPPAPAAGPAFQVVSKSPAPASAAPAPSTATTPPPPAAPAFSIIEDKPKPKTEAQAPAFSIIEDQPPAQTKAEAPSFSVVDDKPRPEAKAKASPFSIIEDKPESKAEQKEPAFSLVDEEQKPEAKTKPPPFSVVEEEPESQTPAETPSFSIVEDEGESPPSKPAGSSAKAGFQVVN